MLESLFAIEFKSMTIARVDSVIECALLQIVGCKNFAVVILSFNFCETSKNDVNVILENLAAVHQLYMKYLNQKFCSCSEFANK